MNIIKHYDKLIDEENDPVHDPEPLKEYMDKWDGQLFIDAMKLDNTQNVLEIGIGTGRIAIKTASLCKSFFGIDISSKTIDRAKENLSQQNNVNLICADFMSYDFHINFDVIYSSLTFMHIKEKQECINKVFSLLNANGRFVLSIDKNQNKYIDFGTRKIEIFPDNMFDVQTYIENSGFELSEISETELAYIFVCLKV